ncbi:response regulator [Sulfurimonas sp.]|uniref:response regulator n=1 Tax=Sulfurimonas sp. TaxID=2022749 RepID=UPI003D0CF1F6
MSKKFFFVLFFHLFCLNVFADTSIVESVTTADEDSTMWIALFGLGLIGILALFLSSEEIKKYKRKREKEDEIQKQKDDKQDSIISKMSKDIYEIAKDGTSLQKVGGSNIAKSENQLLTITTNLIDFLRIKSKKVIVANQDFKLSNLLNEISGTLKTNTKRKEFELLYSIGENISKNLNSDTLNISKILVDILLYCVDNNATQLHVDIKRTSLNSKDDQLSFIISTNYVLDAENEVNIFRSNYNDETEEYDSLGLFIAKELAKLMKGDLIARNDDNKNLEFIFNIPYLEAEEQEHKYSIQNESIEPKNILVIDSSKNSAQNTQKILLSLGHKVKVVDKEFYIDYVEYFDIYDVIFLDEKLFTNKVVAKLETLNCRSISTSNLFTIKEEFPNANIADMQATKPFTLWQVSSLLHKLFIADHDISVVSTNKAVNSGTKPVHRNSFQSTKNVSLSSFVRFQNNKVLLVEDNIINQKVFVGVLGKSDMHITVANHGKEALNILANDKNYDIIFMDINMPVMDGYTATLKMRENNEYNEIPIIALTTLTSKDEVAKMFASGMNGYLPKPLLKEKLYTVLATFLNNQHIIQDKEIAEETEELKKLDGLNIVVGISKSSSNEVFYKEILTEFKDAYGESDKLFEKLVHDFRYEQLRIVCIDLKGLSGTIGAEKLYTILSDILQKLLLKKYDFIPELVQQYTKELKVVNSSIDKYLG